MGKLSNMLHEIAVTRAIQDAGSLDDFKVSRVTSLLDSEQVGKVYDDITSTLGATGYRGMLYVEQGDIGNGLQDIQAVRVNIEARNGLLVDTPQMKKIGHSTLAILRRFPSDPR